MTQTELYERVAKLEERVIHLTRLNWLVFSAIVAQAMIQYFSGVL